MRFFRMTVGHHWRLAIVLVAMTLFARIAVPSGFMPVATDHGIVMAICSGAGPVSAASAMAEMPQHKGKTDAGKPESPCAFSGLAVPSLTGADPFLLMIALVFLMALGMLPSLRIALPDRHGLRPPLRGPPATV